MDNAVLKGSAGYGSRCDSHRFSVVRVGREEKLASNSCGTVSVFKKKIKIKRQLWRCVCFSRVWSLKGRNISCSLELAVRCDLLLQGSQVFSFILFL